MKRKSNDKNCYQSLQFFKNIIYGNSAYNDDEESPTTGMDNEKTCDRLELDCVNLRV